jgi:hypothetical protein
MRVHRVIDSFGDEYRVKFQCTAARKRKFCSRRTGAHGCLGLLANYTSDTFLKQFQTLLSAALGGCTALESVAVCCGEALTLGRATSFVALAYP